MNDEEYKEFVPQVHYELIPIKNLVSNQDYQRNLSQKHVEKAAANFDVNQINPVKVSRRNGVNYVFNGQHTIEIVALVSGSRDTPIWCMIYDDLEYIEEADIFANQMKYTKSLMPYEIFVANIEAGNDEQLIIRDLVESYDLKISGKNGPGIICAVSTLEKIYEHYGYHIFDQTIRLITATWEGEMKSYSACMLYGVSRLIYAYQDELKEDIFKEKLSQVSIKDLSRTAKERRAGSLGYSEAMLNVYNNRKGPRNALPYEKLYSHKQLPTVKNISQVTESETVSEKMTNTEQISLENILADNEASTENAE